MLSSIENLKQSLDQTFHSYLSPETEKILSEGLVKIHKQYKQNAQNAVHQVALSGDLYGEFAQCRDLVRRHAATCIMPAAERTDLDRCDLAVTYAALYSRFGGEGTVRVVAAWIAAKPIRQARTG